MKSKTRVSNSKTGFDRLGTNVLLLLGMELLVSLNASEASVVVELLVAVELIPPLDEG
jgi:hypothetical protein